MGCSSSTAYRVESFADFHEEYVLQEVIGTGGFGQVRACRERYSSDSFAVKILNTKDCVEVRKEARHEVEVWRRVGNTKHSVHLMSFHEDKDFCYMVMEKCSMTFLQAFLNDELDLTEADLSVAFRGMLFGLKEVHAVNIVHRDIKPDNFLIQGPLPFSEESVVKLCDYGLAEVLPKKGLKGICGTAPYMAPEMLEEKLPYGFSVDVWGLGVTAYLLLFGSFPYNGKRKTRESMMEAVGSGVQQPSFKVRTSAPQPSAEACKFVKKLLHRIPRQRPTAEEITRDEFVRIPENVLPEKVTEPTPNFGRTNTRKATYNQNFVLAQKATVQFRVERRGLSPEMLKNFEVALDKLQVRVSPERVELQRSCTTPLQKIEHLSFDEWKVQLTAADVDGVDSFCPSLGRHKTHCGSFSNSTCLSNASTDCSSDGSSTPPTRPSSGNLLAL